MLFDDSLAADSKADLLNNEIGISLVKAAAMNELNKCDSNGFRPGDYYYSGEEK